jgi:hypothetical protein
MVASTSVGMSSSVCACGARGIHSRLAMHSDRQVAHNCGCSRHYKAVAHLWDLNSGAGTPAPGSCHGAQVWNVYTAAHSLAQRTGLLCRCCRRQKDTVMRCCRLLPTVISQPGCCTGSVQVTLGGTTPQQLHTTSSSSPQCHASVHVYASMSVRTWSRPYGALQSSVRWSPARHCVKIATLQEVDRGLLMACVSHSCRDAGAEVASRHLHGRGHVQQHCTSRTKHNPQVRCYHGAHLVKLSVLLISYMLLHCSTVAAWSL